MFSILSSTYKLVPSSSIRAPPSKKHVLNKYRFMANELFKKISFYLIPNKDLCGQLASLRLDPVLVYMGLPVEILNEKKYERKSYEFNFGIIVTYE